LVHRGGVIELQNPEENVVGGRERVEERRWSEKDRREVNRRREYK